MARPQNTDLLQSFRFHVRAIDGNVTPDPLKFEGDPGGEAGFQSCTMPELTIDATEYREGTSAFTKKFPGIPTFSDVSLIRGVALRDSVFYDWAIKAGTTGEYRIDLVIHHFNRTEMDGEPSVGYKASAEAARKYKCYQCLPIRAKPAGDFDATSGEVSLAEVDVAVEYMEVEKPEA